MSSIRRLPPDVASRIAAGEVIERPASVLKELLENSLDAGAAKIQIESMGAGRKSLRIVDDGGGMDAADCRLAFERHATSKIAALEDLETLATFGFRGEALCSITAVSKVSLSSCPKDSKKGYSIEAAGGRIVREHEAPPVRGTAIEVRDLFFNTPARAKFLKSDQSEKGHLMHVVEEAALANPGVFFAYKSENRTALRLEACATPDSLEGHRRRIAEVLGRDLADALLPTEDQRGDLRIRAFLARPDALSASRSLQYAFINRRPVSARVIQQALYRAYEPFRPRDRHPVAVVFLELPPDHFDVNVHPAKREVRFKQERAVFEALAAAFSAALLRAKGIPTVESPFAASRKFRMFSGTAAEPTIRFQPGISAAIPPPAAVQERGAFYPEPAESSLPLERTPASARADAGRAPRWFTPPFVFLGQIEKSYLVFDAAGGLLVVDQHAAQERIFFERYLNEIDGGKMKTQALMLPLPIELPASRIQHILDRSNRLKRLGFEVEAFGKTTLHLTAVPALFHKAEDLKEIVHRLLESVESESRAAKDVLAHATATVACKAAVKAHDRLSGQEALRLLEDLKDCEDGTACPHGRPSMIALSRDELARRFKRPGPPPL